MERRLKSFTPSYYGEHQCLKRNCSKGARYLVRLVCHRRLFDNVIILLLCELSESRYNSDRRSSTGRRLKIYPWSLGLACLPSFMRPDRAQVRAILQCPPSITFHVPPPRHTRLPNPEFPILRFYVSGQDPDQRWKLHLLLTCTSPCTLDFALPFPARHSFIWVHKLAQTMGLSGPDDRPIETAFWWGGTIPTSLRHRFRTRNVSQHTCFLPATRNPSPAESPLKIMHLQVGYSWQ